MAPSIQSTATIMVHYGSSIEAAIDKSENCVEMYKGSFLGMNCQQLLDSFHFCSAGVVGFARGLNDTPKIVALLLLIKGLSVHWEMTSVAFGMAVGGLLNARRVA
ncbi:phosphate/sulphate permease [Candidatus Scalindua japonica]|uniref:Phosphate/sulphate permease n=1 Tax=Candidatus Scalindua japonica TaxID=1284222 RepID=A0A286U0R4_9BACT|nr:phosphate/sulphate permease [Candidatus Scalindua japonica]